MGPYAKLIVVQAIYFLSNASCRSTEAVFFHLFSGRPVVWAMWREPFTSLWAPQACEEGYGVSLRCQPPCPVRFNLKHKLSQEPPSVDPCVVGKFHEKCGVQGACRGAAAAAAGAHATRPAPCRHVLRPKQHV